MLHFTLNWHKIIWSGRQRQKEKYREWTDWLRVKF